eukprot:TRINITY_DN6023_c0_g2_i1.p1 TRINITY_DN6023_c0_g2~~TRINITY_DN6023_c0_g2_i1.p1  ORF type:complete len:161 (+),score=29.96 TRINITY_DN6023_c0_g2_i1:105-587(+)
MKPITFLLSTIVVILVLSLPSSTYAQDNTTMVDVCASCRKMSTTRTCSAWVGDDNCFKVRVSECFQMPFRCDSTTYPVMWGQVVRPAGQGYYTFRSFSDSSCTQDASSAETLNCITCPQLINGGYITQNDCGAATTLARSFVGGGGAGALLLVFIIIVAI